MDPNEKDVFSWQRYAKHRKLDHVVGYPLVNKQSAVENGPFTDGLPIKQGVFL